MTTATKAQQDLLDALKSTMRPMSDENIFWRLLLYGQSGVAKTKVACETASKFGSYIYIESDPDGWVTLADWPELRALGQRMVYQGLAQLEAICLAYELEDPEFTKHKTVVLDTLSAVATLDLDKVVLTRSSLEEKRDTEMPQATQPDYGITTERVRRVLSRLLACQVNIIFVAHEREDKDENTSVTYYRPGFTPKLRKDIERTMTVVGFMTAVEDRTTGEYQRRMQLQPTRTIAAKSRIRGLPVAIDSDTFPSIIVDWVKKGSPKSEVDQELIDDVVPSGKKSISDNDELTTTGLEI